MNNLDLLSAYAVLEARSRAAETTIGGIPDDEMDDITDQQGAIECEIAATPCTTLAEVAGTARLARQIYRTPGSTDFVNLPPLFDRLVADLERMAGR